MATLGALLCCVGTAPAELSDSLRSAAASYYAVIARVAQATNRDSTLDYYWRLVNDANAWDDPKSVYRSSPDLEAALAEMSQLDLSLARQLLAREYRPMSVVRGLGEVLVRSSKDGTMQPVAVYVPSHYAPGTPAALVVFLHGHGQAESHLLALPIITALAERTNTIVVAPYGRGYYDYNASESDVYDALDAATHAFSIAPRERYLAGYSMGGFSAFGIAPMRAGDWSAVMCIAGALVRQKAYAVTTKLRGLRFYVLTGSRDDNVPTAWPTATAAYLRDNGMTVSYYSQPDGTHELRSLQTIFQSAWDDMERGVVRIPAELPSAGDLPVAVP